MGAERKYNPPRTVDSPAYSPPKPQVSEDEHENQPREIKMGKMIFYLTVVLGIWFFYWFNGIQCPC
jgi:hypothetical protein